MTTTTTDTDTDTDTVECHDCGVDVDPDDAHDHDGDAYCSGCMITCDRSRCGDVVPRDTTTTITTLRGDEEWCQSCVDHHAMACERSRCHTVVPDSETTRVSGEHWCQSCWEDYSTSCESCGYTHDRDSDDVTYTDDGTYCVDCAPAVDDDDDGGIDSYGTCGRRGYTPQIPTDWGRYGFSRRHPPGMRSGAVLYFGVEWELEALDGVTRSAVADAARCLLGSAIAGVDDDSSLTRGCEAITQPLTVDAHRNAWGDVDADPMRGLAHAHKPRTCGMHIHATRQAVSDMTWAKVARLLGSDRDAAFWSVFCRRSSSGSYLRSIANKNRPKTDTASGSGSHYDALSFLPSHTVEWRQARGTTRIATIVGTIEAFHSVIRYCQQASYRAVTDDGVDGWLAWLLATPWARQDARHCLAYLRRRGLLDATPIDDGARDETPPEPLPYGPPVPTDPNHPYNELAVDVAWYWSGYAALGHVPTHSDPVWTLQDTWEIRCVMSSTGDVRYLSRADPRYPRIHGPIRPDPDLHPDHPLVVGDLLQHTTITYGGVNDGYRNHYGESAAVLAIATVLSRLLAQPPCRPVVPLRRRRRRARPTDPRAMLRRRGGVRVGAAPTLRPIFTDRTGMRVSYDPRFEGVDSGNLPDGALYVLLGGAGVLPGAVVSVYHVGYGWVCDIYPGQTTGQSTRDLLDSAERDYGHL